MLKRTLFAVLATLGTLAFAASAQAAYLTLGTSNTSNAPTTLTGNTAGSELVVKNTNGTSSSAFGLYGLLTATSPTVSATAVRGQNSSTNGKGFGVYGSQAGSGTGVRGFAPGGKGVWGSSTNGTGVLAEHSATSGAAPALSATTNSSAAGAFALYGLSTATAAGDSTAAVRGQNNSTNGKGYGVFGSQAGSGTGVHGSAPKGMGVWGSSTNGVGVFAQHTGTTGTAPGLSASTASTADNANALLGTVTPASPGSNSAGVRGINNGTGSSGVGVFGSQNGSGYGVYGTTAGKGVGVYGKGDTSLYATGVRGDGSFYGVRGTSPFTGVYAEGEYGVQGISTSGIGVYGYSSGGDGLSGYSYTNVGSGIYAGGLVRAGWFEGNVLINGTCTGCTGPSALQIDDPLDPAHKYLQHSSVASSQQLDEYSGNVTTNGKGFATVRMPRWFQALNRSFRYQLTPVGHRAWGAQAIVWNRIKGNRFTIRSKPSVEISWQVTAVRHDRFAKAHLVQVVAPKAKKDQGKYLHPELYGKPKSEGIGYRKPLRLPRTSFPKR